MESYDSANAWTASNPDGSSRQCNPEEWVSQSLSSGVYDPGIAFCRNLNDPGIAFSRNTRESGITSVVLNRVLHNKQTKRYESKSDMFISPPPAMACSSTLCLRRKTSPRARLHVMVQYAESMVKMDNNAVRTRDRCHIRDS
jgi:hypothetical protein